MFKRPLDYEKTFGDSGQRRQTAVVSSHPLPGWSLLLTTLTYYLSLLVATCLYFSLLDKESCQLSKFVGIKVLPLIDLVSRPPMRLIMNCRQPR